MSCRGHFGPQAEISGWNTATCIHNRCMGLTRNPVFVINGCMILWGGNGPVFIVGRYKTKVTGHRSG